MVYAVKYSLMEAFLTECPKAKNGLILILRCKGFFNQDLFLPYVSHSGFETGFAFFYNNPHYSGISALKPEVLGLM